APVFAQEQQQQTAVETARLAVNTLLRQVGETRQVYATDREAFYSGVEGVLDRFVDFDAVAAVVMNRYLDAATPEQQRRFGQILRGNLTRFYGAALLTYTDQAVSFRPPADPGRDTPENTIVTMELAGATGQPVLFQFQMFRNAGNEWKLRNVSLAGVNLGRQYFTQFSALMNEHGNDIDTVLKNWQ
ncbi:MAG: ABC transporter substrate-binding protein, partial [Gammaproteobacteria bacterium]|nr:ABC transporter substrate-binding protein [Gammaproteobacteria bacterium]